MSGYAYSGVSSGEYKDSLCRAITTGLMPYDEFLKVLRECMLELRSTFNELRGLDGAFEANVHRVEILQRDINAEIATGAEPTGRVLHGMMHKLYDVLYDCVTAQCNQDVTRFIDPRFIRHGAHLQIAKACGVLVNSIIIVNCCAKTFAGESSSAVGNEQDKNNAFNAGLALNAYTNAQFSALSRCLNSSPGPEETERRKAMLRVVRHNMELCNKVSELISPDMLLGFRHRTDSCINGLLDAVKASSAECVEIVRTGESAQRRLAIARKATFGFRYYLKAYRRLGVAHDYRRFKQEGGYACALVHVMGSLFSMYRGYASTGNAEHVVASKIEHCIKILFTLHRHNANTAGASPQRAREIYEDICSAYVEMNEIRPDLLLNPQAETNWHSAALRYCKEMMNIWEALHGRHLDVLERPDGSPDQPSTSGLGSVRAEMGGSPASSESMPSSPSQPSTSGLGSTAAGSVGSSQASSVSLRVLERIPIPYEPCHQPSTSGLGSVRAEMGGSPASSESMPYSPSQPSTSGLGSTSAGVGSSQVSHMPLQDPESMPSCSWDQPSTSGLGSAGAEMGGSPASSESMPSSPSQPSTSAEASSELQEAQVSSHRSRTPSDDELEPPSKRSRSA
ncbi:hypothetical protein ANAPC1_00605 [Anaplasma phagocytophilum]|uniref:HGE-14 protein n=2 Tax=Anaplasma phagocytophilum TaxID=948 RepID=A0AA45USN6_ANAPH|nr:hypothetical protein ANAPC1_00605 [Anaplasma phagocytophilum]